MPPQPPLVALLFEDKDAGTRIFKGWRQELGPRDVESRLRITIITGIDRKHPAYYRLIVAPSIEWGSQSRGSHVAIVSRIHTMTPLTSTNLDRFLNKYRTDQAYYLAPGHVGPGDKDLGFDPELVIACSQLYVRPAWEIADNDPDIVGIREDDDVIIPEGVDEAPVLRTLERIRKRRAQTEPRPHAVSRGKVGRNEACPCGSGKKFKKCHGK